MVHSLIILIFLKNKFYVVDEKKYLYKIILIKMYDIIYYLIQRTRINFNNNTLYPYYVKKDIKIIEKIIDITFDKNDFNENILDEKYEYEIKEFRKYNYEDFFYNNNVYIAFNKKLNEKLESEGEIVINDIFFNMEKFSDENKIDYYGSFLKYEIIKKSIIINNHYITKLELIYCFLKYHIEKNVYYQLEKRPITKFLICNDITKYPFFNEKYEKFLGRLNIDDEYKKKVENIMYNLQKYY
jgi:hypothetical protein